MKLPNTIDKIFPDKADADLWWSLIAPGNCPKCGQPCERDATRFLADSAGKLAAECPHCGKVLPRSYPA